MGAVNIAKLKAQLSAYIHRAEKGETIIVLDRNHPVARLVPSESVADVVVIDASKSFSELAQLKCGTVQTNKKFDSLSFLNAERGER